MPWSPPSITHQPFVVDSRGRHHCSYFYFFTFCVSKYTVKKGSNIQTNTKHFASQHFVLLVAAIASLCLFLQNPSETCQECTMATGSHKRFRAYHRSGQIPHFTSQIPSFNNHHDPTQSQSVFMAKQQTDLLNMELLQILQSTEDWKQKSDDPSWNEDLCSFVNYDSISGTNFWISKCSYRWGKVSNCHRPWNYVKHQSFCFEA